MPRFARNWARALVRALNAVFVAMSLGRPPMVPPFLRHEDDVVQVAEEDDAPP